MNNNLYTDPAWCDKDSHQIFNLCVCVCFILLEQDGIYLYSYVFSHDTAIPLLGMYPGQLKTYVHTKTLYMNVYGSIIHNSQTVETIYIISQLTNG